MRSMPALRVIVDMGQPPQAPSSSMSTTPSSSRNSMTRMSPPSDWRAGRIASTASSRAACIAPRLTLPSHTSFPTGGTDPGHVGAEGAQLAGEVLIATVHVLDAGHGCLALGGQAREHQRGTGTDVGSPH